VEVFDAVLETEALTAKHPSLVSCLDRAMARVLELAREVVSGDDDDGVGAVVGHDGPPVPGLTSASASSSSTKSSPTAGKLDEGDEVMVLDDGYEDIIFEEMESQTQLYMPAWNNTVPLLEFPADTNPPSVMDSNFFTSSQPPTMGAPAVPLSGSFPPSATTATSSASSIHTSTSVQPQIYGNGWPGKKDVVPHPVTNEPCRPPSYDIQTRLRSLGGFSQRLVEHTVTHGYAALLNGPSDPAAAAEVDRAFGYTLARFRTRDQLLENLQWLLGPGREYIYRAAGFPWGSRGGTRAEYPKFSRSWPRSAELLPQGEIFAGRKVEDIDFLTVIGVQQELENLGAKLVDNNVIEITLRQPRSSLSSDSDNVSGLGIEQHLLAPPLRTATPRAPKPTSDPSSLPPPPPPPPPSSSTEAPDASSTTDPNDFFGFLVTNPRERSLTLRLDLTLLITNLSRISMCFVRGPGYPRHELGKAMQASVVTAHWS
jgi:hypothetical protein